MDPRNADFLVNDCRLTSRKAMSNMSKQAIDSIFDMAKSPPKQLKEGSDSEWVETRPYFFPPLAQTRLRAAFELLAYYELANHPSVTLGMMSASRIDQFINDHEEHAGAADAAKNQKGEVPRLKANTPAGRRKWLLQMMNYCGGVFAKVRHHYVPLSVFLRASPNPTRDPLAADSIYGDSCSTIAEELAASCPHDKAGKAGKKQLAKILLIALENQPEVLKLCEKELREGNPVAAMAEVRKADQENLVTKQRFAAAEEILGRFWDDKKELSGWHNQFNGAIREMIECKGKLPDVLQVPLDSNIIERYYESVSRCQDEDFKARVAILKLDESKTLSQIQSALAKVDPNLKKKSAKNHHVPKGANVSGVEGGKWGDDVRKGKSGVPLGVYIPRGLLKFATKAQRKEFAEHNEQRRKAGVRGHQPKLASRNEDFCKSFNKQILEKSKSEGGDAGGGRGGNGGGGSGGNGKRQANEDSGISSKKYKTLVAAVDAQSAKVDEIKETLKQLVAKKGGEANVGSATAVAAGTKKVTVVTPEEATALSGAIAAVQQVRKQAESAATGSTP